MNPFVRLTAISLLSIVSALSLTAQDRPIEFGAKIGVPLAPLVESDLPDYKNGSLWLTVGGQAQVNLPYRLAVEVDMLYKSLGYEVEFTQLNPPEKLTRRNGTFEIPMLLKYYPVGRDGTWAPFVAAGFSLRHASKGAGYGHLPWNKGVVVAVGAERRLGRLRLAPEFRYTHWATHYYYSIQSAGSVGPRVDQFEALCAVTF